MKRRLQQVQTFELSNLSKVPDDVMVDLLRMLSLRDQARFRHVAAQCSRQPWKLPAGWRAWMLSLPKKLHNFVRRAIAKRFNRVPQAWPVAGFENAGKNIFSWGSGSFPAGTVWERFHSLPLPLWFRGDIVAVLAALGLLSEERMGVFVDWVSEAVLTSGHNQHLILLSPQMKTFRALIDPRFNLTQFLAQPGVVCREDDGGPRQMNDVGHSQGHFTLLIIPRFYGMLSAVQEGREFDEFCPAMKEAAIKWCVAWPDVHLVDMNERLAEDFNFVKALVGKKGCELKYACASFQKNQEIVLAAVTHDGAMLEFAHETLQKNKKIVLAAVAEDPVALRFANRSLHNDPEIFEIAGTLGHSWRRKSKSQKRKLLSRIDLQVFQIGMALTGSAQHQNLQLGAAKRQ